MKIVKRTVMFEDIQHAPPLRVVRQDWERETTDYQQFGLPVPKPFADGFTLTVEIAPETDTMGDLRWEPVRLAVVK